MAIIRHDISYLFYQGVDRRKFIHLLSLNIVISAGVLINVAYLKEVLSAFMNTNVLKT